MSGKNYKYPKLVYPLKVPLEYRGILERDPAIERWGAMRETTVKHFKFTPTTVWYCFLWAGVAPFLVYQLIKWDRKRIDRLSGHKKEYM